MVTISPCTTKKLHKLFEQLPDSIYKDDPYYVPVVPGTVTKLLGKKSPFKSQGVIYPFIAYKDGLPVGRIAAIHNQAHLKYYEDDVGFFGFFDCVNDPEVFQALFKKVEETLVSLGCKFIRGPYSPSINEESGLLIEGYETMPFVMMPYHPSYYQKLYESVGLKIVRRLFAYYMSSSSEVSARMKRIIERAYRSSELTVRSMNIKKLDQELGLLENLYNNTLCRNWGFIPITKADLEMAAKDLKEIADPNLLLIAEKQGKPVGFSLVLPNINELMVQTKSVHGWLRFLKFVWLLKTKRTQECRLAILGVLPEFRQSGIGPIFFYESLTRAKGRYLGGELSWIDEDNDLLMKSIRTMGGTHTKTYGIFQKDLH